jgi:glycerol-3-phosphate dehydrogenase subunit B
MTSSHEISCDLVVIGAGMAGMAATLFASSRGIDTVQIGIASEIIFASGLLDLLGVHPVEAGKTWDDPWNAVAALTRDLPKHPYAKIDPKDMRDGFNEFVSFMTRSGLPYHCNPDRNVRVITPLGTAKRTFCVPHTMKNNVVALEKKPPCVMIDIRGLRGYSSRQIAETLSHDWPKLRSATISFPNTEHLQEVYTEFMARSLANPATRIALSERIKPHIKNAQTVGLPAILGMYRTQEILSDLEKQIGLPLFEIPTMPPSIPGLRIKELFESHLPQTGARLLYQHRVLRVLRKKDSFKLYLDDSRDGLTLRANGIILASGRFIGKGLRADRTRIRESIFDLPVCQPAERDLWHRFRFLDPSGHQINRAGIQVDAFFRPLDDKGKPAIETLFAAGSILAHQDWMRMKCGSGLAIATAYAAVQNYRTRFSFRTSRAVRRSEFP